SVGAQTLDLVIGLRVRGAGRRYVHTVAERFAAVCRNARECPFNVVDLKSQVLDAEFVPALEYREIDVAVGQVNSVLSQSRPLETEGLLIKYRRFLGIGRADS